MTVREDDRSLGALFADFSRQLSTLVRQELDLARTEMTAKARGASRDALLIGAGAALLYAAVVLLLVDIGMTPWLAALAVAVVVGVLGAAAAMRGRDHLMREGLAPQKTIETIKDDADWMKEQMP
jgi:heme O synthase-like polyprenyltransferase